MQYTRTSLSLKSASDALFPGMVAHSKPLNFGAGLPILSGAATTAAADKTRAATLAKRNMQFSFEKDQGRELKTRSPHASRRESSLGRPIRHCADLLSCSMPGNRTG